MEARACQNTRHTAPARQEPKPQSTGMQKLVAFANHIDCTPWLRHLIFLSAALLSIMLIGYHFGTFDQAIHIPFLKIHVDPTRYPNDPFFDMRFQHYSYFWHLFLPFYKLGILEITMFAAHLITTYLAFEALWTLSKELFDDALTAMLSLGILALPHLSFAGFQLLEFSLLNRTFVFPFMIWALILFLRQRYVLAFALLGLMYNLHVISVNFVLAMLLFDCLLEWQRVNWKKIGIGLLSFVITALPILLWKAEGPPIDLTLRPAWLTTLAHGILYNVFHMVGPLHIWLTTLSGIGGLALFFIGYRHAPAKRHQRTLLYFVLTVILILVAEVVTTYWIPITIIIQCQIIRIGFWGVLFGYLYFANYLAHSYREGLSMQFDWSILAATCAAAPLAFFPAVIWTIQQRWHQTILGRRVATTAALIIMTAVTGSVVARNAIWQPGIHLYGPSTTWEDAQKWAQANTVKDAVFITPPHKWGFYQSEWRVFSERSTVSTLSELLEAAFVPDYLDYWLPRFETLAPGAFNRLSGDFFADSKMVAEAFYGLSDAALLNAADAYEASYIVVEKPHQRPWPIAYENEDYVIYAIDSIQFMVYRQQ